MTRLLRCILSSAFLLLAATAYAQDEIGWITDIDGTAEIEHDGAWKAAGIGNSITVGDALRTGQPGRVRVVFRDGSTVSIGNATEVSVDDFVLTPERDRFRSVMRLVQGKVRAVAAPHYQKPGAAFEIETPTAVAGVRGTEFVIAYDKVGQVSDVVGVTGEVEVRGFVPGRRAVLITPGNLTTVQHGQYPSPPRRLSETEFRQYLEDIWFIGAGAPESLTIQNPITSGDLVAPGDRAAAAPPPPGTQLTTAPPDPEWPFIIDWCSDRYACGDLPSQKNVFPPPSRLGNLRVNF